MLKAFFKNQRGFTLIEILIVIGIIAILAAIVVVAINPAKQFAQARNTQREAAVNSILNAVGQRMADNKGVYEGSFSNGSYVCGKIKPSSASTTNIFTDQATDASLTSDNFGCLVPTYIASLPVDPQATTGTGYQIGLLPNGRVMVCAPNAGLETAIPDAATICVTR